MSSKLAVRANALRQMLAASEKQIAIALPRHLTPERMIRVAMTTAQKSPKILECDPRSVVGAVVEASQLGLEPDGVLGHAYLVPYKNRCTLIPGYKGLIHLARQSGLIASIYSYPVFASDKFQHTLGLNRDIVHVPSQDPDREDPAKLTAVYAVAVFKDGEVDFEVMSRKQVEGIRRRSASASGPWSTDYVEMSRKTVLKRLCKRLPMSTEMARAVQLDNQLELGEVEDLGRKVTVHAEVVGNSGDMELDSLTKSLMQPEEPEEPEDDIPFGDDQSDESPPEEPEDDGLPPDRRHRSTVLKDIRDAIKVLGQEVALEVRDKYPSVVADGDEAELDDLRALSRELSALAAQKQ